MEADILAAAGGIVASIASVVRAIRNDVAGACAAAGVALIAFAAAIGNL